MPRHLPAAAELKGSSQIMEVSTFIKRQTPAPSIDNVTAILESQIFGA